MIKDARTSYPLPQLVVLGTIPSGPLGTSCLNSYLPYISSSYTRRVSVSEVLIKRAGLLMYPFVPT